MERYTATFLRDDYWYTSYGTLIGEDAKWGNTLEQLDNQIRFLGSPTISSKIVNGEREYVLRRRFMGFGGRDYRSTLALIEDGSPDGNKTIIYSNGFYTNGEKIITPEIEEWFEHFMTTIDEPAKLTVKVYSVDGSATSHLIPANKR